MEDKKDKDNKKNFEDIYEREADSLFRYTIMKINPRTEAKDVVQDVFIEFWQVMQRDELIKNPRAYLFTILRNRIIDWYRKKKMYSLDAMLERNGDEVPFDVKDSKEENRAMLSSETREIIEVINTLEPSYKDVVYLRLVEDLNPEEIGRILEINTNAVSIRITRGVEKIRNILKIEKPL
ncbi:MAG: RNA polymerase sigma factor [bacterium]|nr:RNA polymerase sigma factor [bacterium]